MAKNNSVGRKNERIAFEREVRTPDGMCGFEVSWQQIGEAMAFVAYKGSGEAQRQGAVRELLKYSFVVWAAAIRDLGITRSDRIRWNGEVWNIRELDGGKGGALDAEIIAESGVTQ